MTYAVIELYADEGRALPQTMTLVIWSDALVEVA